MHQELLPRLCDLLSWYAQGRVRQHTHNADADAILHPYMHKGLAEEMLLVYDLKIFYRVHSVLNMSHFWVLKASADMEDAVHCLYVR